MRLSQPQDAYNRPFLHTLFLIQNPLICGRLEVKKTRCKPWRSGSPEVLPRHLSSCTSTPIFFVCIDCIFLLATALVRSRVICSRSSPRPARFLCRLSQWHLSRTKPLTHCEIQSISSNRVYSNWRQSLRHLPAIPRREAREAMPIPSV